MFRPRRRMIDLLCREAWYLRHAPLTLYERQIGSLDDRDSTAPLFAILRLVLRFRPRGKNGYWDTKEYAQNQQN
jgi:hypothetical protein